MATYNAKLLHPSQRAELLRLEKAGKAKVERKGDQWTVTYTSQLMREVPMSKNGILSTMKFVTVEKHEDADPVIARRNNMVRGLKEQIAIFDADEDGKTYHETRKVFVDQKQDDGTTKRVEVERDKRLRRHWFQKDDKFYVEIRYGNRPLPVVNGQHIIECGGVKAAVRKTFDTLIRAVEAGELDEFLRTIKVNRVKETA
ncbi:hypothetical protein [Azospirillum rugosum]|uniref:Uncharacterized protein n=1 Tax=Azospirillum rugosum TaxID=416170 RepID=A0ABS4SRF3_9PROT|nr:hypothetical protein [Azospirillum rugosum]MBP2295157.1 hypothetical protein [Azospirillum rugosum]MDQ0528531.1 hypothetical protein [Azospirillum rugosum]